MKAVGYCRYSTDNQTNDQHLYQRGNNRDKHKDSVIINCLGDLVDKTKKVTSPDKSKNVTKTGCGGLMEA